MFLKHFEPLYMIFVKDRAAAVRDLGIQKMPDLFAAYKEVWRKPLLAKLSDLTEKESTYYVKISAIYSLEVDVSQLRLSH